MYSKPLQTFFPISITQILTVKVIQTDASSNIKSTKKSPLSRPIVPLKTEKTSKI